MLIVIKVSTGSERLKHLDYGNRILSRGNSNFKSPEAGACLPCRNGRLWMCKKSWEKIKEEMDC